MVGITQLDGSDLEEFIQNHTYVIVGFFSKYSAFCAEGQRHLEVVVNSLASHGDTQPINFAQVFVEDLEGSYLDYEPVSFPSLVFYYSAEQEKILGSDYIDDNPSMTFASILNWILNSFMKTHFQ